MCPHLWVLNECQADEDSWECSTCMASSQLSLPGCIQECLQHPPKLQRNSYRTTFSLWFDRCIICLFNSLLFKTESATQGEEPMPHLEWVDLAKPSASHGGGINICKGNQSQASSSPGALICMGNNTPCVLFARQKQPRESLNQHQEMAKWQVKLPITLTRRMAG